MKSMRMASVWLLAMALVGFAYPALAQKSQTKYGSVSFQGLLSGTGTVTVPVTFTNSTPKPGVSTINSAWIKITNGDSLPANLGVARVLDLSISGGGYDGSVTAKNMAGALCSASNPCKEFTITDFTGISNNQTGTFRLELVNVSSCVNISWDAAANTGNSYPGGDAFLLTDYNMATGCDGTLDCWTGENPPELTDPSVFIGSISGASTDLDPGYFVGYRAADWKSTSCTLVPFKTYNNIGGTASIADAFNTTVPPNFAVINYSGTPTNGVLLAHTITFAVEPSDSNGLPDPTKVTYYCVSGTDCQGANRKVAQGCLSPAIDVTSIPGTEPGCIRGANWVIVPATDDRCEAVNTATVPAPACIQWAIDFLEKGDPPWGRTQ